MSRLRGKRACITGGGGAPGLAFAREGAAVAVVDVVADAAEQTVRLVVEGPIEDSHAVASACAQAVTAMIFGLAHSSLDSMLATPTHLVVVCRYDATEELQEEEPEYDRPGYRVLPPRVVVASSGWGRGWRDLANGQMLVVERATLASSIRSIALETPHATG